MQAVDDRDPFARHVRTRSQQLFEDGFRSLRDFTAATAGTGAKVAPWLQDFSLGVTYGDAELRAQIDATRDAGIDSFFLWNAATRYHGGGLQPA